MKLSFSVYPKFGSFRLFWEGLFIGFFEFLELRRYFDLMGVFGDLMTLCPRDQHCSQWTVKNLFSVKETASLTLGMISVVSWVGAEIPQIITNFRNKSTEGLSTFFLTTWIVGDLFNLIGCELEPATLPTQYYTALLYTLITLVLTLQTIFYGYIHPRFICNRQNKAETPKAAHSNSGGMKSSDISYQCNEAEAFSTDNGYSSPIPLPALPRIFARGELYYQSARSLSTSHTPTAGSVLAQRMTPTSADYLDSKEEPLLAPIVSPESAPDLKKKNTLCLVSTFTLLGALNLLQSPDRKPNSMVKSPRHEFVMLVGRKLFQANGVQLLEHDSEGSSGIGVLLGWGMAALYMSGRLPQIHLNIKRGNVEGLNPLMFFLALIGNATYVGSILACSLEWSKIRPNLPWLVDAAGCIFLDIFILIQFIYFRHRASNIRKSKTEHQSLA
ncbi:uncharacterized protein LOC129306559 isoform X1 [Prosopis cineraria]|uniref:uncharacterized protein LOC129306559 isoform X1 n=2 Tax=Prosopis cineraria TaxID=364024 RepID=UPI00240F7711|nr:uncharacterized protein LOC129306559 isoform X1 [Prosopis cineraria]